MNTTIESDGVICAGGSKVNTVSMSEIVYGNVLMRLLQRYLCSNYIASDQTLLLILLLLTPLQSVLDSPPCLPAS